MCVLFVCVAGLAWEPVLISHQYSISLGYIKINFVVDKIFIFPLEWPACYAYPSGLLCTLLCSRCLLQLLTFLVRLIGVKYHAITVLSVCVLACACVFVLSECIFLHCIIIHMILFCIYQSSITQNTYLRMHFKLIYIFALMHNNY